MTDGGLPERKLAAQPAVLAKWPARNSLLVLALATLAALLPFSNKAFHIDDPLFVWTAQHIAQHPLDPYGFQAVWYTTQTPIADVTKNPPLASYYMALFGRLFGWSERVLHLAFLLPALFSVLGTYQLARRYTRFAFLAAAAALLTPAFLVSSTTLMCDVLMLALWVWAVVLWLEGIESGTGLRLLFAALLAAACALTKYFGVALLPLLLAYAICKRRNIGLSIAALTIPVASLAFYQRWTRGLYGRGLFSDAFQYASLHNRGHELPLLAKAAVGLAFTGGCLLPALVLAPMLWRPRWICAGAAFCGIAGLAIAGHPRAFDASLATAHWPAISAQMALFIAGGISALAAGFAAIRKFEAHTALLSLWALGTFFFGVFLNWTINARSILPMVPAIAILLVQSLEAKGVLSSSRVPVRVTAALACSGFVSLWVTFADANLANTARAAAERISNELRGSPSEVYFEGHWGFQYYMQQSGAKPADLGHAAFRAGDIVVIPENTTNSFGPPPGFTLTGPIENFPTDRSFGIRQGISTMSQRVGAGFYASVWGPLPFYFGAAPPERYMVARLTAVAAKATPAWSEPMP